jgi:serine/threonine-protein kinase HipA
MKSSSLTVVVADQALAVLLSGARAGTLTQDRHGRIRFAYEEAYRDDPGATPLSSALPLTAANHAGRSVLAYLTGLLPDSRDVLERWGARFRVSANNPFALLRHVGEDCAGAVQFVRPERLGELAAGSVTWLGIDELAERVRQLRVDPTSWLGSDNHEGHFSLAGAQAKFAILRDDGRWGDPSGAIATTHIVKPTAGPFVDQHLNEHLCLSTAAGAGLLTVLSEIVDFAGEPAVVVTRYDRFRPKGAAHAVRVHQEDFCQALSVMPERKYQSDGGPGAADLFQVARALLPGLAGDKACGQLVDALAFNWLIGGSDAHAKNFSLLMSGPAVRLAPLYDLASILPYRLLPGERLVPGRVSRNPRMAMRIGEYYEIAMVRRDDWVTVARWATLDPDAVLARVEKLADDVVPALLAAAAEPAVTAAGSKLPTRLVDEVGANVARCRSALSGRPARSRPRTAPSPSRTVPRPEGAGASMPSSTTKPLRRKPGPPSRS